MSRIASAVASCFGCSREGTAHSEPLAAGRVAVSGRSSSVGEPHSDQGHPATAEPLESLARVLAVTDQPPANVNESQIEKSLLSQIKHGPTHKTLEECQAALAAYSSRSEKDPVAELIAKSQRIDDITPLDNWLDTMKTANTTLKEERKSLQRLQRMSLAQEDPNHSVWEETKTAVVGPAFSLFSKNKSCLETQILQLESYLDAKVHETTAEETPSPTSLEHKIRSLAAKDDTITLQLKPLIGIESLTQRLLLTEKQKRIKAEISTLLEELKTRDVKAFNAKEEGPQITEIEQSQEVPPNPQASILTSLADTVAYWAFLRPSPVIATAKVPLINAEDLE
ncbi:MAG: hypothetical protein WCG14_01430 [Chlamydiia bacterium]